MLCLVPPETTGPIETLRLVPPETTEPTQTLCFTAWFPLKHNWRMALQTDSLPKEDWAYTACCDKQECQDSLTHTLIWMQLYFFPEFTGSTNLAHGKKSRHIVICLSLYMQFVHDEEEWYTLYAITLDHIIIYIYIFTDLWSNGLFQCESLKSN